VANDLALLRREHPELHIFWNTQERASAGSYSRLVAVRRGRVIHAAGTVPELRNRLNDAKRERRHALKR
jgi:hypothetical protein